MHNMVYLIGRLKSTSMEYIGDLEIFRANIEVTRNYKGEDGIYDSDIIPIRFYVHPDETVINRMKPEDLVGIKGRLETDLELGLVVTAEKFSCLPKEKEN